VDFEPLLCKLFNVNGFAPKKFSMNNITLFDLGERKPARILPSWIRGAKHTCQDRAPSPFVAFLRYAR
jgi:hypothetical protein